ncbi:hypothetical protein EV182_006521, partial [Spiromyces aspiralis]
MDASTSSPSSTYMSDLHPGSTPPVSYHPYTSQFSTILPPNTQPYVNESRYSPYARPSRDHSKPAVATTGCGRTITQKVNVPAGYYLMLVPENQYDPNSLIFPTVAVSTSDSGTADAKLSPTSRKYNEILSSYPPLIPNHSIPNSRSLPAANLGFGCFNVIKSRAFRRGPQRPPNAFILYRSDKHRELLKRDPKKQACLISQEISRMWANETPEVRRHYHDLAAERKASFEANRRSISLGAADLGVTTASSYHGRRRQQQQQQQQQQQHQRAEVEQPPQQPRPAVSAPVPLQASHIRINTSSLPEQAYCHSSSL